MFTGIHLTVLQTRQKVRFLCPSYAELQQREVHVCGEEAYLSVNLTFNTKVNGSIFKVNFVQSLHNLASMSYSITLNEISELTLQVLSKHYKGLPQPYTQCKFANVKEIRDVIPCRLCPCSTKD